MAEITNRSNVGMDVSKDGVDIVVLPDGYSLQLAHHSECHLA